MILVGKLVVKRPLGKPRRRWVDNNRIGLWGDVLYRVLVGKPEGKGPLWRHRRKCVDNIMMDLWEEGGV